MGRILAFTSALAWALACSSAQAATVTSTVTQAEDRAGPYLIHAVTIAGAPGERNVVRVSLVGLYGVRVHDTAGVTAAAPCVAEDAQTVTCPERGSLQVAVELGDGDDELVSTLQQEVRANGGPGDDTLILEAGTVVGGPGRDILGADTLDYGDHPAGAVIDLGADTGEDHILPGTDRIYGSPGPDRILAEDEGLIIEGREGDDYIAGSPLFDLISPGPGDDEVRAYTGDDQVVDSGGGDDLLDGGRGNDHLNGGPGDDVLIGSDGRDGLYGEAGTDRVRADDGERDGVGCTDGQLEDDRAELDADDLASDCEHVTRSGARRLEVHGLLRTGGRHPRLLVSCPRGAARRACAGTLRLRSGGLRATLRAQVAPGRRTRLRVDALPARGTYRLRAVLRTGFEWRAYVPVVRP